MSRSYKQPYTKSKRFDASCRCNGGCPYCLDNRMHKNNKHPTLEEELKMGDYNMIQPESKLPWSIEIYGKGNSNYKINEAMGSMISKDDAYEQYPLNIKDVEYIVVAANQYPILLDFLEKLEASTTDKNTAEKIRKLLIEQGLWS